MTRIAHLGDGRQQRLSHLLHRAHQMVDFVACTPLHRHRNVQLACRNLAAVLARQVDRRKDKALHQQANGDNHHHKQAGDSSNDRQAGDEATARIFVQAFGVFLVDGKHLVENDLVLAVEAGDFRDERVKFGDIVRLGGVDQRRQPLVAVVLPGVLIGSHQRRFIAQTRRSHKGRKGVVRFGQRLFHGGQLCCAVRRVARFHHLHILHHPHAQRTAVVDGVNNGQHNLDLFVDVIQGIITFNDDANAGDGADNKEEKQREQDNQGRLFQRHKPIPQGELFLMVIGHSKT